MNNHPAAKTRYLTGYLTVFILYSTIALQAQPPVTENNGKRIYYWDDIPAYLNDQAKTSLDIVTQLLKKNPPTEKLDLERKAAFILLDNVLHQSDAAHMEAVQHYYHNGMVELLHHLQTHKVSSGATIYKLYNHGFIVASANATIAFDLTRAGSSKSDSFALSDSLTRLLIDECDILFVSHWHQDHADDWVAENFLSQHKTVVSPDSVWIDKPFYASITHPVRSADSIYRIGLRGNHTIKYRAMPGHQGNVLNNVYIVTMPDGLTFAHTGDQYNPDDFSWIDSVRTHFRIDGLFLNSWSLNVYRLIKGFSPRFIFPSHEDELGHPIDHREAYWLTMDKFRDLPQKVIYMTWGEVFHIDQ